MVYPVEAMPFKPDSSAGPIAGGKPLEDASQADAGSDESCDGIRVEPRPIEIEIEIDVDVPEVQVPKPVSMYFMLDRSASMEETSGSDSKWDVMVDAINTFANDSDSNFLALGLQYFPVDGAADCDGTKYETPAVPVRVLPDNAHYIEVSLADTVPGVFTPMEPALIGVTGFCQQFQAEHPDEPCVGVLVSDGAPTQCALDSNTLAARRARRRD